MILAIYGASGLGREIYENVQLQSNQHMRWENIVFVDDINPDRMLNNRNVVSFDQLLATYSVDQVEFIIAVGEPFLRQTLYNKVKNYHYSLASLIHPTAIVASDAHLEEGSIINAFTFISSNVTIGVNTLVQNHVSIGHDSTVGMHSVISAGDMIGGLTNVGSCTYIAMGVPVKDRITIGSASIVGLGSAVSRDIPDNVIAMGNPARGLKNNEDHQVFRS